MNFTRLVDWMEGRLPAHEVRDIERAVAGDDTPADVAWLRKFFAATDNAAIESPPRDVRDALVNAFEDHARDRRGTSFVERALAGLAFDSNLQPAAGLRALGAQSSRRQLVYHTDAFDLAVNLLARGSDLELDGQVLPHDGGEQQLFSVQLLREGDEFALTVTDELGSFAVERVPPGRYELVLSADRIEISISPLDVGL